jgi:hypothetical protein
MNTTWLSNGEVDNEKQFSDLRREQFASFVAGLVTDLTGE